ncbi:hypothetical protein D3C84_435080 [compost metagenome]
MLQGFVQVLQGLGAVQVVEGLAHPDGPAQGLAGTALLAQQALAAEQHVAVEEGLGQLVVGVVGGAGALVDILGQEVELEVAVHLGARTTVADPVQDDVLGRVQRRHHATVLLRQGQAPAFHVELVHRLQQGGFQFEVLPQFTEQPGQALLHRLVGEECLPEHREQAVPGGAGHQQRRFLPEVDGRAVALVDADHGVDGEDQGRRGDGRVALAEGAEHGQAEAGQRQGTDEDPGVREQEFHREGGDAENAQGYQQCGESPLPAVVGFGQGAGDDAEEQRDQ